MKSTPFPAQRPEIYAFDKIIIGYCLIMVLVLLTFGNPMSDHRDELLFYASVAGLVVIIVRFFPSGGNRYFTMIRFLYPCLLFTFFYRETGGTMFLLFDSFYDWQLTALEQSMFGVNPTIYIDQHMLNVWLNEIFSACYFLYYLMIPFFIVGVFVKKDFDFLLNAQAAIFLAFVISYILFFLYPIEGPRWHFASQYVNQIDGLIFRPLTELVIEKGAVRGGCMPSSHFAVALVILLYTFKRYRRIGWILLPLVTGLAIGTVWGRFHYVSDVIVGGLIGLGSTLFIGKCCPISPGKGYNCTKTKESLVENVS